MTAKKLCGRSVAESGFVCKALAFCLAAAVPFAGAAADSYWSHGNGDICDASLWSADPRYLVDNGDGTVTTNEAWCRFLKPSGTNDYTVTMSEDMRLFALAQQNAEPSLTVRLALAPHTLSLSYNDAFRIQGNNNNVRLESGTLSTQKPDGGYGSVVFWDKVDHATFAVDGPDAVLDGPVNLRGGNFCAVEVLNGGKVTRGVNLHGYSNNRLLVSGAESSVNFIGANFDVGGWHKQNDVIDGKGFVTNNIARIADGGMVTNVNEAVCGFYGSHSLLDIDGGMLFANRLRIGRTAYSHDNTVRIANSARVVLSGQKRIEVGAAEAETVFGGGQTLIFENYRNDRKDVVGFDVGTVRDWEADYGKASSNNTVKIVNSVIDIPVDGRFSTYGGANNGIVVSGGSKVNVCLDDNGNLVDNGSGIIVGGGNFSHGNYLIVTGEGSVISNFNMNSGTQLSPRNARGTLLEASDGGVFYGRAGMNIGVGVSVNGETVGADGGGATVRAVRGGRIAVQTLSIGKTISHGGQMASNRVESIDRGLVEVMRLRFWGQGNTVFLSNGTVRVTNEFYTVYGDTEDHGKNTRFVFAGTSPRFEHTGNYHAIRRETILRYEIPDGGYAAAPYERTAANAAIAVPDDTTLELDLSGFLHSGGRTALMKAPGGIQISEMLLNKWNAGLPEGCSLYLSKSETLVPSADGTGTILAIRAPRRRFQVIVR